MKKYGLLVIVLILTYTLKAQITAVSREWANELRSNTSDTLYVVNFWATWCKPCVNELPYFQKIADTYAGKNVKVILVSNDMRRDMTKRVPDFIKNNGIKLQVLYIDEVDADLWISKVNKDWTGAIPATWMYNGSNGKEDFTEGELTFEELENKVKAMLE